MEYFRSIGGNNSPYFRHRVKVRKCTDEMFDWCRDFSDEEKNFRRWHVEWGKDYDVVQFEWEEAAVLFALMFGCL
jgi:hypothetical protein